MTGVRQVIVQNRNGTGRGHYLDTQKNYLTFFDQTQLMIYVGASPYAIPWTFYWDFFGHRPDASKNSLTFSDKRSLNGFINSSCI